MTGPGGQAAGLRVGQPGARRDDEVHPVEQGGDHRGQLGAGVADEREPVDRDPQLGGGEHAEVGHADDGRPRVAGRRLGQQGEQQRHRALHRHGAATPQAAPREQPGEVGAHG